MSLYEETLRYVQNDRDKDFAGLLDRIPFRISIDQDVDEFFIFALKLCTYYQASNCCKSLYQHWIKVFNIEEVDIPYFIYLMTEYQDVHIFTFLHRYPAKHFTYEEIVDTLIMYYQNEKVARVISKCEQIFGRQVIYFYREMYRRSVEDISNPVVAEIMSEFLKEGEVYAEYPSWTFPQKNVPYFEDNLPADIDFKVEITDLEKVADMVMEFSELQGDEYKQEKKHILDILYKLPEDEIKTYVESQFKVLLSTELASNEEFFHAYGPSHPISRPLYEVEERFGGSRMFLSIEQDFGYEEPEQIRAMFEDKKFTHDSWFTGNCGWCFRKIRRWRHALRMPLDSGGWIGCYCSSACITEAIIEKNIKSYYLLQLWSKIYQDIQTYGIQDFIETEVVEILPPAYPKHVSFFDTSDIQINRHETVIINEYNELSDLIFEHPEYLIFVLFVDDETSQGIIDAYQSQKGKLIESLEEEDPVIFILYTLVEDSDLDDTNPPEFISYYREKEITKSVNFDNYERDILEHMITSVQKSIHN